MLKNTKIRGDSLEKIFLSLGVSLLRVFLVIIAAGSIGAMIMGCLSIMSYISFDDSSIEGEVVKKIKSGYLKKFVFYIFGGIAGWRLYFLFLALLSGIIV